MAFDGLRIRWGMDGFSNKGGKVGNWSCFGSCGVVIFIPEVWRLEMDSYHLTFSAS